MIIKYIDNLLYHLDIYIEFMCSYRSPLELALDIIILDFRDKWYYYGWNQVTLQAPLLTIVAGRYGIDMI
jgi:hypothetical protein